jgi:hypothetical protein
VVVWKIEKFRSSELASESVFPKFLNFNSLSAVFNLCAIKCDCVRNLAGLTWRFWCRIVPLFPTFLSPTSVTYQDTFCSGKLQSTLGPGFQVLISSFREKQGTFYQRLSQGKCHFIFNSFLPDHNLFISHQK